MKQLILCSLLLIMGSIFIPKASYAQPEIAEQPCDSMFWSQMTSRAWQEAEREIMQNQNLIFKPDSVMDYTCFDQFANIAAAQGGEIFTHTNYFGEKIIERSMNESTNNAIQAVVSLPLQGYKIFQFNHDFLGGRAGQMQARSTSHSAQNPTSANTARYQCSNMAAIWQAAKCANFIDNSNFNDIDGFYPFKEIKGFDGTLDVKSYEEIKETRLFPGSCNGASQGVLNWEISNSLARNEAEVLYQFQSPLGEIYKEVNDKIEPGNCTGGGIETGVTVITKDGAQGSDGVCSNPGCSWNEGGSCSGPAGGG